MQNPKTNKADELFFVVDEHDVPLRPLPRALVHGHGIWHRVSHVWVLNGTGKVLCQQRSLQKENSPGFWEPFFGGHLAPSESYDQGAKRELYEEIGLLVSTLTHQQTHQYFDQNNSYNNEFQGIFTTEWSGDLTSLHFNDGEVKQVKWIGLAEVLGQLRSGAKNWTNCGYEIALITRLLGKAERMPAVKLLPPVVERDALYAYRWFTRPEGKDTLRRMGNAEHEIPAPSLKAEQNRVREFIELEAANKQITRMINVDDVTVGAVWLELTERHGVKPPSIHIMIGDPDYRGKGVGKQAMLSMIEIAKNRGYTTIYTRHLVDNTRIKRLNDSLGFINDGDAHTDANGLNWQPIRLDLGDVRLYD